jgi:hypothetical protein
MKGRCLIFVVLPLLMGSACDKDGGRSQIANAPASEPATIMKLHIKLREGFRDNSVLIRVNGKEVYRKSGVSTDLTISYADALEVDVKQPVVSLEVTVEGGAQGSREVRVGETSFVEVWIMDGRLEWRTSAEDVPML